MVRAGAFEFSLVEAESKVPFKEHRSQFDGGWGPSQAGNVGVPSYEESSET